MEAIPFRRQLKKTDKGRGERRKGEGEKERRVTLPPRAICLSMLGLGASPLSPRRCEDAVKCVW